MPATWEVTEQVPDCALVAAEPSSNPEQLAANVVVTLEEIGGQPLEQWVARSRDRLLDGTLDRLWILDSATTEIDGRPAQRTLSHYLHETHGGLNLEQWQLADQRRGYVISCSTAALDYDALADTTVRIAEGLRIEAPG